jgi:hypothetical protein
MEVPEEIIRAGAAMWNAGPKIIEVLDIAKKAQNTFNHAWNAHGLKEYLRKGKLRPRDAKQDN